MIQQRCALAVTLNREKLDNYVAVFDAEFHMKTKEKDFQQI